jgi:hypothetical protein
MCAVGVLGGLMVSGAAILLQVAFHKIFPPRTLPWDVAVRLGVIAATTACACYLCYLWARWVNRVRDGWLGQPKGKR